MNGLSNRAGTDKRSSYDRPLNRVVQISKKSGGYYFKGLSIWCPKPGVVTLQTTIDHHLCWREFLKEIEDVCLRGGFKTRIKGKTVVLIFFVQFIVGDAEGHDDLCAHYRKNECRCCLCPRELMSKFDPNKCVPLTMRDILNTNGDPVKLHAVSQRHRVPNAFYRLPFADPKW